MICSTCGDKGIVTLNWADASPDYALCLCAQGLAMRRTTNEGRTVAALWEVWAAREQVAHERIFKLEDVLTADELKARGLVKPKPELSREAALLAAGKGQTR